MFPSRRCRCSSAIAWQHGCSSPRHGDQREQHTASSIAASSGWCSLFLDLETARYVHSGPVAYYPDDNDQQDALPPHPARLPPPHSQRADHIQWVSQEAGIQQVIWSTTWAQQQSCTTTGRRTVSAEENAVWSGHVQDEGAKRCTRSQL